ncbi:MAG TPA: PilZ domain-containing protein [Terriglobales bacterium]
MARFSGPPDRRVSPRFQAEVPLVVSVVGEREIASLRAQADGISEGGLSLSGIEGMRTGQAVSLEMHLPIATHPIWVEALVRHDSGHYGLQFQSLSAAQKKLIKRYCSLQPRQKRR